MPIEERFITFNMEEVYKAVIIYAEHEDLKRPPAGELTAISLDGDKEGGEDIVYLNVVVEGEGEEPQRLKFFRSFFAKALVFYCQGGGIPLPKAGKKILAVMEDKIVMKITLE